jgi:3',5'-cyclic AMP phosphodiesterase CpdA
MLIDFLRRKSTRKNYNGRNPMFSSAIIHISDVEFGPNHRALQESTNKMTANALEILIDDFVKDIKEEVIKKHGIKENRVGLVITGDVAHAGSLREYKEAEKFINSLKRKLFAINGYIAVVPGNHDVNWEECKYEFDFLNNASEYKENILKERMHIHPVKLKNFTNFFNHVLGGEYKIQKPTYFPAFNNLNIALVGIDTTYPSLYSEDDNFGLVKEEQIQEAGAIIAQVKQKNPDCITMLAMHHSLIPDPDVTSKDSSFLHYARKTAHLIKYYGFQFVLCGHEHTMGRLSNFSNSFCILTAGSFGLCKKYLDKYHEEGKRPETNKYNILLLGDEGRFKVLYRRLNRMDKPLSLGYWEPDVTDALESEEEGRMSVLGPSEVDIDTGSLTDEILSFGETECYLSLSKPEEKLYIKGVCFKDDFFPLELIESVEYRVETHMFYGDPGCSFQANIILTHRNRTSIEAIIKLKKGREITVSSTVSF